MSDSSPGPETVIDRAILRAFGRIQTIRIGIIDAFDPDTGEADVQPADMLPYTNELGVRNPSPRSPIPHVPVYFPGGGGARDTWPVRVGDACILLHPANPIARWLVQGGIVDENNDLLRHHVSNAIALVGITDFGHWKPCSSSARVIEADDLRLGGQNATESVLYGTSFVAATDSFLQALNTFVAEVSGLPGMSGPATTMSAAIVTYKAQVDNAKSARVKVL